MSRFTISDDTKLIITLGAFGIVIGVAKMLASNEPLKFRQIIGRSLLSGALGIAAASAVILFPAMPFTAQVGLACVMASLGTSAIEMLFRRVTGTNHQNSNGA